MEVTFERTGERRYAVKVVVPGHTPRRTNPAPGFDDHIPHDLVHYLVEAELHLAAGVFGRAERGGGAFFVAGEDLNSRQRSREQRRQRKRELALDRCDNAATGDMARAERLALLCDVTWRRRQGQRGDQTPWRAPAPPTSEEAALVERVVARLDPVATLWHSLPVGGSISFAWPSVVPMPRVLQQP